MAFANYFFFGALLCMAHANPLGQTTVCETAPNFLPPQLGSTTICETSPNRFLPYQVPGIGSTTVCESAPNLGSYGWPHANSYLPSGYWPYPLSYPHGSTTICESNPNLLSVPSAVASTTVCETVPNMLSMAPSVLPFYPPAIPKAATTVCETVPNVMPYYPYSYPMTPSVGSTTVCESAPNVMPFGGVPLSYPGFIPGLGRSLL